MAAPLNNKNHYKHGLSHTRIDHIYKSMIARCQNPKCRNYPQYGGRGIDVCEEWLNDKVAFFDWSFKHGYTENLTIDRIDNNKGYSPENCRWTTYKVQGNNRRVNHYIKAFGETKTMAEWSEIVGISQGTIFARLKSGWDAEKALSLDVYSSKYSNKRKS